MFTTCSPYAHRVISTSQRGKNRLRFRPKPRGRADFKNVKGSHGGMTKVTKVYSANSYEALHGLNQLFRVVAEAVFKDDFHLLDVADSRRGISFHHH